MWHYLRYPTFSRFDTTPECDRHTHTHIHRDRQTDRHTMTAHTVLSIASRGKNLTFMNLIFTYISAEIWQPDDKRANVEWLTEVDKPPWLSSGVLGARPRAEVVVNSPACWKHVTDLVCILHERQAALYNTSIHYLLTLRKHMPIL